MRPTPDVPAGLTADEWGQVMTWAKALGARYARRLGRESPHTADDLAAEAVAAALAALPRYDPAGGANPVTFLSRRMAGEVVDAVRRCGRLVHHPRTAGGEPAVTLSITEGMRRRNRKGKEYADGYQGADDYDPAARPEAEPPSRYEFRMAIRRAFSRVGDQAEDAVVLYFGDGLTMREIAGVLGLSESRVSQLVTRAIQTIHERRVSYPVAAERLGVG